MKSMIKLAITGAGYIANIHALAIKSIPGIELVAVVDRSPQTAASFAHKHGIKHHYQTVEELLQHNDIDSLVIATPNYLHAPQAITALRSGVPVMVEKPMAMNADQAYQMLVESQKSGSLLMVAHCWRFDPEVLWLRHQALSDRLGKIIRTKGYGVHQKWGPSGWFTQHQFAGGGAMADVGIHALDTARFLLNDPHPASVYARIGTYYTNSDVDDTGLMLVNWDNGVTSYIEAGWWQPHTDGPEAATQLYGTKGFGQLFPTYLEDGQGMKAPSSLLPRKEHSPQSLYNDQMAYFIQCIQNYTQPTPGAEEGWINMQVVDAAMQSSKTGKVINIR